MAPSAIEPEINISAKTLKSKTGPLKSSGSLDKFEQDDVTPVIGTEFPKVDLVEWLNAPNADELIRDLAIKISERGVVFFRAQDKLTNELQKKLINRLGELAGRPAANTLHIHPILNPERELGGDDPEISTISSIQNKKIYTGTRYDATTKKADSNAVWHSDIAFEPVPADYTSLRLTQLPKTGGDTLWASGYELYDRLSAPYQAFLSSLTATFAQPGFNAVADRGGFKIYSDARGAPENVGSTLSAIHPVVRTNPVTGWRSLFPVGAHVRNINGVTEQESKALLEWFVRLLVENHDLQVRFRWRNENDIAIWDNRSVFHTATYDYQGLGERFGNRAVGLGERPFLDPESTGRRQALEKA